MRKSAAVRLAACLLAAAVAGAPLPSWAGAAPAPLAEKVAEKNMPQQNKGGDLTPSMSLEKAIAAAREKVPVPAELDMFSSDYQEYGGRGRWVLRWYSGRQPKSSLHVSLNASNGEIENMNYYRGLTPGATYRGLPAFSKDQCLEIARKEAARLQPERFASTVPAPRDQWYQPSVLKERDYPIIYDFNFKRTSGGIPVSDQGINVGVNAETGEVVRFDSNWNNEIVLPAPEGRISAGQARKIFMEKAGYELTYYMIHKGDPDEPGELRLVYRLKPPGRFILNALTGEVIDTRTMDIFFDEMGGAGGAGEMMLNSSMRAKKELTPAENRAVQETRDLISADQAQEIAGKYVEVPKGYTAASRNLERHYGIPGSRVWNIQFADSEKKNWIRVSVDAKTGELTGFSKDSRMNPEDYYKDPEVKVSEEEARKAADNLVGKLQPLKAGQVVFRQSEPELGPWIKMGKPAARGYMFSYARMVNGVVYPENGFRVRVSSTAGEVLSYDMFWWETSFPKPEGVIGEASANERFLAEHPLTLEYGKAYKRWTKGNDSPEYYLIYRPSGGAGAMLDAVSGTEIDYQGNPVVKKGKQPFTDISGHPAEEDIKLLAGEGIITGDRGKFRPDDPVTAAEMLAMLVKAYNQRGPYYPLEAKSDPWYKPVIDGARAKGILDKDFTLEPEAGLNRIQLARLGINAGGWGKLARVSWIFKIDVSDAGSIPEEYRGYVSAALGMDLMMVQKGEFNPGGGVTRAEAASFLVKLLKQ